MNERERERATTAMLGSSEPWNHQISFFRIGERILDPLLQQNLFPAMYFGQELCFPFASFSFLSKFKARSTWFDSFLPVWPL
jgi:hypothetical protein